MGKNGLTKEEYILAQKRASHRLDKIMPKQRRGDPKNFERGIKYRELLKEEMDKIESQKK